MKTRIFNLIILDESGSMYSIAKPAVDGVNETVQSIRAAQKEHPEQEHYVMFVTFNDNATVIYDNVRADEVAELSGNSYNPQCCTALYDAMGMSLTKLQKNVAQNDKVLVTIVTDGYENASREYNGTAIKKMVEDFKKMGWVFVYMGANQDVEEVGRTMSISNVMPFQATCDDTRRVLNQQCMRRRDMYDRISTGDFCPEKENKEFFNENVEKPNIRKKK